MDDAASDPTLVITVRDCKDDVNNRTDRSRIHERTILLRFLGTILSVLLRQEVYIYNVYIINQFHTTSAGGEGG